MNASNAKNISSAFSPHDQRHRGVVLVIMLLAIVLIASLLYYVLNLGKHVNNRIVAQHSADAAANAQGTWIARQFNTVAMNNITITRYLASIPVMDCQPMIAHAQYEEYRDLLNGLQETYDPTTGRNSIASNNALLDSTISAELSRLHTEMIGEQQQLYDVYNTFLGYDVTQDTRYPGNIWDAISNLNEISIACMDSLPEMAGLHAENVGQVNMEADNSPNIFVTTIPSMVNIAYRHSRSNDTSMRTHFDDFRNPVMDGNLPDYMNHRIINRGPFDTIFGQRSLTYSLFTPPAESLENQNNLLPGMTKPSPVLAMLAGMKFDTAMPDSLFALHDTHGDTSHNFSEMIVPKAETSVAVSQTTSDNPSKQSDVTNASLTLTGRVAESVTSSIATSPFGGGYQGPPSDTTHTPRAGRSPSASIPTGYRTHGIIGRILNGLHSNPNHRAMPFNRHINLFRQNYAQWSKYVTRNELNYLWPDPNFKQHDRFARPVWTERYPATLDPDDQVIARTAYLRMQIKSRYRWGDGFMEAPSDGSTSPSYRVQTNFGQNASNQVEMRDSRLSGSLYMIMSRGWWLGDVLDPMALHLEPEEPEEDPNPPADDQEEPDNTQFTIQPFAEVIPISSNNRVWLYLDHTLVRPVPNGDRDVGVEPFDEEDPNDHINNHVVYIYQVLVYLGINENPLYIGLDNHQPNPHENRDLTDSERRRLHRENDNTFAADSQLALAYPNAMRNENFVEIIPNPYEGLDHDEMPGPVIMDTRTLNRTDDYAECDAARAAVRDYQDDKLTFMAFASRQNRAAFWPSRFDRTKPTNRTSAVAQVVIFNNHSFDLWTPMWQSQLEQTTGWQNWIDRAQADLDANEHPWATESQLQGMITHLQAITPLAEARLSH
ncbi:MAG TPA: hypothetical protein DCM28_08000 [Phycisphaerales bacterium]|nr:hypothetical protein [Phycisphaerales bacterium]HCD34203.1 hypothetical protein [Phycisphaerales bacterium]|tara:strand:+ start:7639 stop:10296 length:2658 start_codon:yes stop_codon:yes gene_type:complete